MNDRELLELAAKAAGMDIYESTDGTLQNRPVWVFSAGGGMGTMPYEVRWNPLNDDAQALRLAVKLGMDIDSAYDAVEVKQYSFDKEKFIVSVLEDNRNDPYAATRRAIVRAAAEIGKEMK